MSLVACLYRERLRLFRVIERDTNFGKLRNEAVTGFTGLRACSGLGSLVVCRLQDANSRSFVPWFVCEAVF